MKPLGVLILSFPRKRESSKQKILDPYLRRGDEKEERRSRVPFFVSPLDQRECSFINKPDPI
jgi:hypothetical protein